MNMIKKMIAAFIAIGMLAAIVPASMAQTANSTQTYNGFVGADSPLYSIKIFIQNLDVYITFNNTDKMKKQMAYADERLAEARAAVLVNNSAAVQAALDQYDNELDELNQTTTAPDINQSEYSNLSPVLDEHEQEFYNLMNNSTVPEKCKAGINNSYNHTLKLKKGMPFYIDNGSKYFLPPGLVGKNGTHVPPGLAKKGYVMPTMPPMPTMPAITNGSNPWPWDEVDYQYHANASANGSVTNGKKGHGVSGEAGAKLHGNGKNSKNNNQNNNEDNNGDGAGISVNIGTHGDGQGNNND